MTSISFLSSKPFELPRLVQWDLPTDMLPRRLIPHTLHQAGVDESGQQGFPGVRGPLWAQNKGSRLDRTAAQDMTCHLESQIIFYSLPTATQKARIDC